MRRLIVLLLLGASLLMANPKSINTEELLTLQAKGVPVIDIRTPKEWNTFGIIKGAHTMMYFDEKGNTDSEAWLKDLERLVADANSPVIIYCAHANRTRLLGRWLMRIKGYRQVYELFGGIEYGWIDLGRPTVPPGPRPWRQRKRIASTYLKE